MRVDVNNSWLLVFGMIDRRYLDYFEIDFSNISYEMSTASSSPLFLWDDKGLPFIHLEQITQLSWFWSFV